MGLANLFCMAMAVRPEEPARWRSLQCRARGSTVLAPCCNGWPRQCNGFLSGSQKAADYILMTANGGRATPADPPPSHRASDHICEDKIAWNGDRRDIGSRVSSPGGQAGYPASNPGPNRAGMRLVDGAGSSAQICCEFDLTKSQECSISLRRLNNESSATCA